MFYGKFIHSLNTQGRVSIPAVFREAMLEEKFSLKMILVAVPGWIDAFPVELYKDREAQLKDLPEDDPAMAQMMAVSRSNLAKVEVDGQGRILLSPELREELGLERDVLFVGFPDRIRIYEPNFFKEYITDAKKNHQKNSKRAARYRKPLKVEKEEEEE